MSKKVEISKLEPNPFNPREHFDKDKIKQLASSIEKYGLNNPITVRKTEKGCQIVEGHRRVRAVKELGWEKIEAKVKDLSDQDMLDISISENLQRENLTKVELAEGLKRYEKQGLTQKEIAEKIDKSQGFVSQVLQFNDLPENVKEGIITRVISGSHGRALVRFKNWYLTQICEEEKLKEGLTKGEVVNRQVNVLYDLTKKFDWSVRTLKDYIKILKCNMLRCRWELFLDSKEFRKKWIGKIKSKEKIREFDSLLEQRSLFALKDAELNSKEMSFLFNEWTQGVYRFDGCNHEWIEGDLYEGEFCRKCLIPREQYRRYKKEQERLDKKS